MTVKELIDSGKFEVVNVGSATDTQITDVFCCDLLSIAMSRGIEGAAWVTVMGNVNTLAVLSLTDMSCIVLAEGTNLDQAAKAKAVEQKITVLRTDEPEFKAGLYIHGKLG